MVGGEEVIALVDSGCTETIVARRLVHNVVSGGEGVVVTVDGAKLKCEKSRVTLLVDGRKLEVSCIVLNNMLSEFELILGMDVVKRLGGVTIGSTVTFGMAAVTCRSQVHIDDVDFTASFDGSVWTVKWKWLDGEPKLKNNISCYKIREHQKEAFVSEIDAWINEGILEPVPESVVVKSILPLMAVEQNNKDKIRPVLDFRDLNNYVSSHSGGAVACDETLRRWRQAGQNIALIDLRKAYLQIHVDKTLHNFQIVQHKGKYYYLTRLGFGLNSAPKIMSKILEHVLAMDDSIAAATDSYIDDIAVNKDLVSPERVAEHLSRFGLTTKPVEEIDGARVLGLRVTRSAHNQLLWSRGNDIPKVVNQITRRDLFSICGQLIGHYPVAGWLRVACGYVKRSAIGTKWDDYIGEKAYTLLVDMLQKVEKNDPVGGVWAVDGTDGRVWCDASSLALGCVLEVNGTVVEDISWLRKMDDGAHINMSELDAVVKGINLAVKWSISNLEIMTDSVTVYGWLRSSLQESHKIKTRGMNEMLVKRRLAVVKELIKEYGVNVQVRWVKSADNKADDLTRVPHSWMKVTKQVDVDAVCGLAVGLTEFHNKHHFGVERTLHLAKSIIPNVTRRQVREVVNECVQCQSIDPAPITWEKGELECKESWYRIATDVTHYANHLYLTFIDCGPSRFTVWKKIWNENAETIVAETQQLFVEHGPPTELLMDNGPAFRSRNMKELLRKWSVNPVFRCAYRPSGNGIVERIHRTVKRMAARTGEDPREMTFWYNVAPKVSGSKADSSVPAHMLHSYMWRMPVGVKHLFDSNFSDDDHLVGKEVFVKPPNVRCTQVWPRGTVTAVLGERQVEVDGIPRHVADVRLVPNEDGCDEDGRGCDEEDRDEDGRDEDGRDEHGRDGENASDFVPDGEPTPVLRRSVRVRKKVERLGIDT